uniref:Inositol monophosphatase n=1 Tax=Fervidicoccus fontis TaxID=683846 RepID=A0A7C1I3N0_9CREN
MGAEIGSGKLRELAVLIGMKTAAKLKSEYTLIGNELSEVEKNETIKADLLAENYIVNQLKELGFKGKIVTEETGVIEVGNSDIIAIIDPLDGSINYSLGIPWFSISIAFAQRSRGQATLKDLVAGAVVPVLDPIPISFSVDRGVYIGETKIESPPARSFTDFMFIAFYGDDPEAMSIYSKIPAALAKKYGKIKARSLGSVALDLVYLSLRKIDLFIDARAKLRNIDLAAALGILRELNGTFKNIDGMDIDFSLEDIQPVRSLVASWSNTYLEDALDAVGDNIE